MSLLSPGVRQRNFDTVVHSKIATTVYYEETDFSGARKALVENRGQGTVKVWWQQSRDLVTWTDITPRATLKKGKTRAWGLVTRFRYIRCIVAGDGTPTALLIGVQQVGTALKILTGLDASRLPNVFVIPWKRRDGYEKEVSFLRGLTTTQYAVLAQAADSVCVSIPEKRADGCTVRISSRIEGEVYLWVPDLAEEDDIMTGITHFASEFSKDVVFGVVLPANYTVFVTPSASVDCWVSNRSPAGFTINTSATVSCTVDWVVKKQ